jgi:hypothetical protein
MAYQTSEETFENTARSTDISDTAEGVRIAQGLFLDELPGAMFVFMTLMWVVSTIAGLFF